MPPRLATLSGSGEGGTRKKGNTTRGLAAKFTAIKEPMTGGVCRATADDLGQALLTHLLGFVPLKDRLASAARVCRDWQTAAEASIDRAWLYAPPLCHASDVQLYRFFAKFGRQIKAVNFDLFRVDTETSQWRWRQIVVGLTQCCSNLQRLDAIFCARHKLRDKDLIDLFSAAPGLKDLRVDAQFLSGHCFAHSPALLRRLELDKCGRVQNSAIYCLVNRCHQLQVLHLSQFENISNKALEELGKRCHSLEELSLVCFPNVDEMKVSTNGLMHVMFLPRLRVLCLEGIGGVTDRFLQAISRPDAACYASLKAISLAF